MSLWGGHGWGISKGSDPGWLGGGVWFLGACSRVAGSSPWRLATRSQWQWLQPWHWLAGSMLELVPTGMNTLVLDTPLAGRWLGADTLAPIYI